MPLHLLGKKSWNVYNPENIARVRKDEAIAEAEAAEHERQQRDHDSAKRLELLRSDTPNSTLDGEHRQIHPHTSDRDRSRKKRRLNGEDDTDRDLRLARADAVTKDSASLFDSNGHINLVSEKQSRQKEIETAENEQGLRFKDAAGRREHGRVPWYANNEQQEPPSNPPIGHDAWGNEDPRRREREQQRISTNDPLMAMKKGIKKLKENDKQKKEWMAQRERDLNEVEHLARKHHRRRRSRRSEDSLEGFSLDANDDENRSQQLHSDRRHHEHSHKRERHRQRHRHQDRHRDRPRSRSPATRTTS